MADKKKYFCEAGHSVCDMDCEDECKKTPEQELIEGINPILWDFKNNARRNDSANEWTNRILKSFNQYLIKMEAVHLNSRTITLMRQVENDIELPETFEEVEYEPLRLEVKE